VTPQYVSVSLPSANFGGSTGFLATGRGGGASSATAPAASARTRNEAAIADFLGILRNEPHRMPTRRAGR